MPARTRANESTQPRLLGRLSVMMNVFRAKAVANIALTDGITLLELAEKYDKEMRLVTRDLKPAVEGGLLSVSAEGPDGIYAYIPPADPIARRIVELSV